MSNAAPILAKLPSAKITAKGSSTSLIRPSVPNTGNSRLLGMPPEVRRLIYTYTFSFTFPPVSGKIDEGGRREVPIDKHYASILLVCRQIYWEACVIPFQVNFFRIKFGPGGVRTSSRLFSSLSSWQTKEVRNVALLVSESQLWLAFYLDLFVSLLRCKYFKIEIEGNLSKEPDMDMLSKIYDFQSVASTLEHLRIAFEEYEVCSEGLKNLEKDLKALLPKIQVMVWKNKGD